MHLPLVPALTVVVAALTLGCSSDASDAGAADCRADPGLDPEHQVVKCVVGDRCEGQAPHPSCPSSTLQSDALCAVNSAQYPVTRAACGQNTVISWSGGTVGFLCLYDPEGTLVGSLGGTDSPEYCGRFGRWTWGKEIPLVCQRLKGEGVCGGPTNQSRP